MSLPQQAFEQDERPFEGGLGSMIASVDGGRDENGVNAVTSEEQQREAFSRTAAPAKKKRSCDDCGYVAPSASKLATHVQARHLGFRPYKCARCPYEATQKGNLKKHMQSKHGVNMVSSLFNP
jgi:hypothetical protein